MDLGVIAAGINAYDISIFFNAVIESEETCDEVLSRKSRRFSLIND